MAVDTLKATAQALVAPSKGILAADESTRTIKKRFEAVGIESTEETRRQYRELLLGAAGLEEHISGVILYDETIRQAAGDGTPFPLVLSARGVIPGIKVDKGTVPLAGYPGELVTEGLDGLRERLAEYREMGARFAKWRAVIGIGIGLPTDGALAINADALARYAALAQEADLVPIVEPEVLMEGGHTLERAEEVTTAMLAHLFAALRAQRVLLEGLLLKPNMVVPGKGAVRQATPDEVAEATLRTLRRTVPAAVPGIVFLSGGQTSEQATANLNAINSLGPQPWQLSFSFARALQQPALETWRGQAQQVEPARKAFLKRARLAAAAREGRYTPEMERAS